MTDTLLAVLIAPLAKLALLAKARSARIALPAAYFVVARELKASSLVPLYIARSAR